MCLADTYNAGMAHPPKRLREYLAALGSKGGKARAKRLTPAQRTKSARRAAQARWEKERKAPAEGPRLASRRSLVVRRPHQRP